MKSPIDDKTISVVVPAYNEEKNLDEAVGNLLSVLQKRFRDYEILIFDDCSLDRTGEISDKLASKNKKIRVIHNAINMGIGYNYMKAAQIASMEYFSLFPGDGENIASSIPDLLKETSKADIIIPYPLNAEVRPRHRRLISNSFVLFLNKIFNLKLKYYNGTVVYKTKVLKSVKITTYGFAYSSEVLVKLLKRGYNYVEVGVKINPSKKNSIFKLKNIFGVFRTIIILFYEINIKERKKYRK